MKRSRNGQRDRERESNYYQSSTRFKGFEEWQIAYKRERIPKRFQTIFEGDSHWQKLVAVSEFGLLLKLCLEGTSEGLRSTFEYQLAAGPRFPDPGRPHLFKVFPFSCICMAITDCGQPSNIYHFSFFFSSQGQQQCEFVSRSLCFFLKIKLSSQMFFFVNILFLYLIMNILYVGLQFLFSVSLLCIQYLDLGCLKYIYIQHVFMIFKGDQEIRLVFMVNIYSNFFFVLYHLYYYINMQLLQKFITIYFIIFSN